MNSMQRAQRKISRTAQTSAGVVLDILLPPRCPICASCGLLFDHDEGADLQCGVCLRQPPPYVSGRSVMRYDDAFRELVLGFKHGDRTESAPMFGRWLYRMAKPMLKADMLVVPVLLHCWWLFSRRYNQSAMLAAALVKVDNKAPDAVGLALCPDLLLRGKRTPTQGGLSARARRLNVRGTFLARPRRRQQLRSAHILLVDDVMTTGATLVACCRALLKSGAASVSVLPLARVVRPSI